MANAIVQNIKDLGGFIRREEIPTQWSYRQILEKVSAGELVRVRRGVYAIPESLGDMMYDIKKIVPGGVLCSYSTWWYYQLTAQIPDGIYVAVPRGRKIRLPDYPNITICHVSANIFGLGVTECEISGFHCPIYDIERSVCDAIKARNKIGIDVCSEIVNAYLKRKDRNLAKLTHYAKFLRVLPTLNKYLEISL